MPRCRSWKVFLGSLSNVTLLWWGPGYCCQLQVRANEWGQVYISKEHAKGIAGLGYIHLSLEPNPNASEEKVLPHTYSLRPRLQLYKFSAVATTSTIYLWSRTSPSLA